MLSTKIIQIGKKTFCLIIVVLFMTPLLLACGNSESVRREPITWYKNIPNIQATEIAAIDKLRTKYAFDFIYDMPLNTEAFIGQNGENRRSKGNGIRRPYH